MCKACKNVEGRKRSTTLKRAVSSAKSVVGESIVADACAVDPHADSEESLPWGPCCRE